MNTQKIVETNHGTIQLPAFMPDATYGSVRSTSFPDVIKTGIREIVTTTLHIEQKIGSEYIKKFGGIHKFFGWDRPILTDSGGWQVFSLINSKRHATATHPNPHSREGTTLLNGKNTLIPPLERGLGGVALKNTISEVGCSFTDPDSGKSSLLTPESSIQIQHNLGADIMTVLDNPILGNASLQERTESVRINTKWAKRARKKFDELCDCEIVEGENEIATSQAPRNDGARYRSLLGCVIQGGDDFKLRKQSAEELIEIGFDVYNFGGVPLLNTITWLNDYPEGFYYEMLEYVSNLIPEGSLKYAMGVGQPDDIAYCVSVGWQLFDTVLPTRNARHGYLYVSEGQGDDTKGAVFNLGKDNAATRCYYDIMHLRTERYEMDNKPVDEQCDCECCRTVSRAYLRHLIRIKEPVGFRLATIHNLRFYAKWMEMLKSNL